MKEPTMTMWMIQPHARDSTNQLTTLLAGQEGIEDGLIRMENKLEVMGNQLEQITEKNTDKLPDTEGINRLSILPLNYVTSNSSYHINYYILSIQLCLKEGTRTLKYTSFILWGNMSVYS